MPKIGSAPKPSRRNQEAHGSATILPFRLRASRSDTGAAGKAAPLVEIEPKALGASSGKRTAKTKQVEAAERLTIVPSRYREWLKQALIGAVILHLIAFAMLHFQFVRDVERAASAGATVTADGTAIIHIDIVVDSKLPDSKTPTNMTAPDAKKQTNTSPQVKQDEKQKEAQKVQTAPNHAPQFALPREEFATPQKAETSPAPQSPNQEKQDELQRKQAAEKQKALEQKKRQEQAAPSIAASPNRAAPQQGNQNQSGANGFLQNGGQADASSYSAIVLAHLQRYRIYPDQARSAGITGVSTVRFTIGAGGNVISAGLAGSSGQGVLDQAALAMVHRASPFPPIPASLGRGSMTFAAPVRFNLR
jgi:protein TonB